MAALEPLAEGDVDGHKLVNTQPLRDYLAGEAAGLELLLLLLISGDLYWRKLAPRGYPQNSRVAGLSNVVYIVSESDFCPGFKVFHEVCNCVRDARQCGRDERRKVGRVIDISS